MRPWGGLDEARQGHPRRPGPAAGPSEPVRDHLLRDPIQAQYAQVHRKSEEAALNPRRSSTVSARSVI